jgi:ADP-heptose:LPS heptosyltransferase
MRNALLRLVFHLLRFLRPRNNAVSKTFLVLQYRFPLGCCVHGTPVYAALKTAHPDATIVVATRGLGFAVLQHDPHIDHLIETPEIGSSLRGLFSSAQELRATLRARGLHPSQILQDASNRRGTLALFALLLRLAPVRGFAEIPQLYDEHLVYDSDRSLIDNNLRLVGPDTPHVEPAVYFTARDLVAACSLRQQANAKGHPLTAFVVQGSGAQPNNWHDDRFAEVIRHVESLGHRTVFLGTDAEAGTIDRIRALAESSGRSLAGSTSVAELAALLCLCDLLITLDTGAMHVGRAAGLPMIVLGPSWQKPVEWLPLALPNVRVLRGPDSARGEVTPDYRLDEITVESVIAAFTQLDSHFPPSVSAHDQRVARLLSETRA